jgi:hypothetical protein
MLYRRRSSHWLARLYAADCIHGTSSYPIFEGF